MATKRTYNMDIWAVQKNINKKNVKYFDTLSEEAKKEFSPFVMMRWLTGRNDGSDYSARQIYILNEFVNPYAWSLGSKHKKLLYGLMTACSFGRDDKYKFNKAKGKHKSNLPLTVSVIQEIFGYNHRDADDAIILIPNESIINMAEQLGRQTGEIKELKKELRTKRPK